MAEAKQWTKVENSDNSWFHGTPDYNTYDSLRSYDAEIPYNLGSDISPRDWNTATVAQPAQWSEAA